MENPKRKSWYETYNAWVETVREPLEQHNFREGLQGYPRIENRSIPWTPFSSIGKTLPEVKLGLVSTAGIYVQGEQTPFDAHNPYGDATLRSFPRDTERSLLSIAHEHYDNTQAQEDINTVLPLDRLSELQAEGLLGSLDDTVYSLSGYAHDAWAIADGAAKEIAYEMVGREVDAALVVPV